MFFSNIQKVHPTKAARSLVFKESETQQIDKKFLFALFNLLAKHGCFHRMAQVFSDHLLLNDIHITFKRIRLSESISKSPVQPNGDFSGDFFELIPYKITPVLNNF